MMMLPSSPESSQNNPQGLAWDTLPDLILSDILMKVGLNSLGDLYRCDQVCSKWSKRHSLSEAGRESPRLVKGLVLCKMSTLSTQGG